MRRIEASLLPKVEDHEAHSSPLSSKVEDHEAHRALPAPVRVNVDNPAPVFQ